MEIEAGLLIFRRGKFYAHERFKDVGFFVTEVTLQTKDGVILDGIWATRRGSLLAADSINIRPKDVSQWFSLPLPDAL